MTTKPERRIFARLGALSMLVTDGRKYLFFFLFFQLAFLAALVEFCLVLIAPGGS
jgi:hypothetical protein